MKKSLKIIITLLVLLLIIVILDMIRDRTSLFIPQDNETRYILSKAPSTEPPHKLIEKKSKEKVTILSKSPFKLTSFKDNGKQYFLNNGRWVKVTTNSDLYPPPYYIFENNDYLIIFQQNYDGSYQHYIEIKYRVSIGDGWYDSEENEKAKLKTILVSKNATVKTPSQFYYHCIETKISGNVATIYNFYAPSQFLVKSEIENTKTNRIISSYYLSKTN